MSRKTFTNISLDTEADKDILRWLERQENKSAAVRAAIREHIGRNGLTLGDVYRAVKELERKLEARAVVLARGTGESEGDSWDEPDDAAAALDALAELGG
jgi:hypothetical protein